MQVIASQGEESFVHLKSLSHGSKLYVGEQRCKGIVEEVEVGQDSTRRPGYLSSGHSIAGQVMAFRYGGGPPIPIALSVDKETNYTSTLR